MRAVISRKFWFSFGIASIITHDVAAQHRTPKTKIGRSMR
jgi:hypothetical protein